jgi:Asp-tRNA(Asn)/Glu-tRNA(Gln) amidotransferase A subunit family amidase
MGIYRDWWASADPRVVETCDRAIAYFAERRGYEVIDISIPHISEGQAAHSAIIIAELLASVRRKAAPNPNNWHSIVSPPNKLLLSAAAQENAVEWLGSNRLRELLMRHLAFLFQSHPGLLIMTPTTSIIGWARQPADDAFGVSDTNKTVESMKFIFLANLTGIPAVSAPVGYVDPEQGEGRLAIGLQAMGEWGAEEQLLAWAREAEEYLHNEVEGGRRRPETWFDVFAAAKENKTY